MVDTNFTRKDVFECQTTVWFTTTAHQKYEGGTTQEIIVVTPKDRS